MELKYPNSSPISLIRLFMAPLTSMEAFSSIHTDETQVKVLTVKHDLMLQI